MAQQARDEAGNIWDVSDPANPVLVSHAGGNGGTGRVIPKPADPQAEAELTGKALGNQRTRQMIGHDAATAPFDARRAAAATTKEEAEAVVAQSKAEQVRTNAALAGMTANSDVHGDAYLRKFVPPQMWNTVKAYARGDLGSKAGGMSSSMLPIIQHAMNYDPTTSATTFPARVKMQSDLAGSQPGTAGGSLRSMEQMVLHGSNVLETGRSLGNFGPGVLGHLGNVVRNRYRSMADDPTLNAYNQEVKNYAPESQKGIAGVAGVGAEREERAAGYSASSSQAARAAALQADARMAFERMGAVNDQYKRLMGRDITDQMSPAAKAAYDKIMAGGYDERGHPMYPAAGYNPDNGTSGGGLSDPSGGQPGGGMTIAMGVTRTERDDKASALIDTLVRRGAGLDEINAAIAPMGMKPIASEQFEAVQKYLKANPGYIGGFGEATRELPTTRWGRFAASPVGTGMYAAVDAGMGGLSDEVASLAGGGDLADLNARKQAAFAANPMSAFTGQAVGTIGAMTGLGTLGRSAGFASRFGLPGLAGDIAFGAASGAGQSNDNRLLGGSLGAIGGGVGHVVGMGVASSVGAIARTRPGLAATNGLRGMFGASRLPTPAPLSSADGAVFNAINRAGVDDVRGALTEARGLNLPMSLADTNPNLRELAGAAVRRSPTAASFAEDALFPRSRGQFDRFTSAVETNLGPTTNIPQRSADLMTQARAGASDIYDQAYRNPVPSTPELDGVLRTPFGKQALGRAQTIAANERRSPSELGFAQDADGNTVLNPMPNRAIADHLSARDGLDAAQDAYRAASGTTEKAAAGARVQQARQVLRDAEQGLKAAPDPSVAASVPGYTTQTLDYVKRGMDDVLEEKRNPITGKLVLDEAGRAQNGVRGQLLSEVDRLNPDFATARAAYAGPMQSRDALSRGVDAYGLQPDQLGMQVAGQTPEHLTQMQLGFRGALVDHAGKVRDNSNPWEATLGSPTSRQRLDTLYPDNPGVGRLLRQRDLEGTMAKTKDAVLGNSKTAGRQIMDKVFEGGGWLGAAGEAALAVGTHGATLPLALRRFAGEGARDMYKLGVGGRATAKADAIAPVLLNTDPSSGLGQIEQYLAQQEAYRALVERTTPKALGGMFGRAFGSQAAIAPLNQ